VQGEGDQVLHGRRSMRCRKQLNGTWDCTRPYECRSKGGTGGVRCCARGGDISRCRARSCRQAHELKNLRPCALHGCRQRAISEVQARMKA
jgi:hypothetical protein